MSGVPRVDRAHSTVGRDVIEVVLNAVDAGDPRTDVERKTMRHDADSSPAGVR